MMPRGPLPLVIAVVVLLAGCSSDDKEARRRAAGPAPTVESYARVASAAAGARIFTRCSACHSVGQGAPDLGGPNLHGVIGAEIGQNRPRFAYTAALQNVGGRWTRARLDAWLADPQRFAPGTAMAFPGLADPLDRADVIAYLETQR
ncbi:c-type cytochrome [Sphingomonas sp. PAMC 26621]|uniref:c-type cytochrome n=1 Tax=Sphingomonas sp. PAMC 26621 TaxID=1112213 RepID=UPI000289056A|nr:c-type cytochrome [Sphingomonas sp. PAMC 26621]